MICASLRSLPCILINLLGSKPNLILANLTDSSHALRVMLIVLHHFFNLLLVSGSALLGLERKLTLLWLEDLGEVLLTLLLHTREGSLVGSNGFDLAVVWIQHEILGAKASCGLGCGSVENFSSASYWLG
jgi:hypothetical protein